MQQPRLSILIVTYNSSAYIANLLHTLQDHVKKLPAEVVVVDNASRDGCADLIARTFPWVRLVRSTENLGFAAGNNLAARHASGRFLLLLNPDAVPEPGTIERAVALMHKNPKVGLCGALLLSHEGKIQPSARMFPSLTQEFFVLSGLAARFPKSSWLGHLDRTWADPHQAAEVDWVPGAFAMVRSEIFHQLGGFDERFFLYYEEVDLCRRIHAQGLKVMYWPSLRVYHIGGACARTVQDQEVAHHGSQLTLWRARSGLLYYRKNHGLLSAWAMNRLERNWYRLRTWYARLRGQTQKAQDCNQHTGLVERAWKETMGGRVCPPRPW